MINTSIAKLIDHELNIRNVTTKYILKFFI